MNIFLPLKWHNDTPVLFTKNKRPRNSRNSFLYILSKMKCTSGIILPENYPISLNDSSRSVFPFNIPFHPGEGPEIIYPDGPLEQEDPEEDPGDEPDD